MANDLLIIQGDARAIPLADSTVQCVVTSPPYWGLRKYQGAQDLAWGGEMGCEHVWGEAITESATNHTDKARWQHTRNGRDEEQPAEKRVAWLRTEVAQGNFCQLCGAWRGGYGLEPTIEMYVDHTVQILREIRRVLRRDGVVFWNIGDSYAANRGNTPQKPGLDNKNKACDSLAIGHNREVGNLKPKDLCLIPERVALAAQADGWWVRSRIVWAKPNPMPESVTDRPTDAMEHIWMFTRSERYFWDADAVRERTGREASWEEYAAADGHNAPHGTLGEGVNAGFGSKKTSLVHPNGRNLRNVWTFPTQPYKGAHFATFPEEIPRRCILAATSERGACIQCGAPWGRVSSRQTHFESGSGRAGNPPNGKHGREWEQAQSGDYDIRMGPVNESQTIGWRPGCECRGQRGRTRPCLMLDPFGGSGTTARVAVALNRRAVSLDLAYHDHAEARTRGVQRRLLSV